MPKVSVIMPVWNAEEYLARAVDSVLRQTLSDFELIAVDDGSTDGSGGMLDEYARNDPRVRVVHRENGGIGAARATALALAAGEYVAFIDNDDEMHPRTLEDNYALAKKHDADIVWYGKRHLNEGAPPPKDELHPAMVEAAYSGEEIARALPHLQGNLIMVLVWDKLFRRELLTRHGVTFDARAKYGDEDTLFTLDALAHAKSIVENPKIYYTHYGRGWNNTARLYLVERIPNKLLIISKKSEYYSKIGAPADFVHKELRRSVTTLVRYILFIDSPLTKEEKKSRLDTLNALEAVAALSAKPIRARHHIMFALLKKRRYGLLMLADRVLSVVNKPPYCAKR